MDACSFRSATPRSSLQFLCIFWCGGTQTQAKTFALASFRDLSTAESTCLSCALEEPTSPLQVTNWRDCVLSPLSYCYETIDAHPATSWITADFKEFQRPLVLACTAHRALGRGEYRYNDKITRAAMAEVSWYMFDINRSKEKQLSVAQVRLYSRK